MAAGDLILSDGTTMTPEDLQKIAAAVTQLINSNAKDPGQWETVSSLQGITSMPVFQVLGSTYKLVRVAVELLKGADGKQVELQLNSAKTYIQWRYTGEEWQNLIAIELIHGETPEFRKGASGVEWKYKTETTWKTLIPFSEIKWNFDDLTEKQLQLLWSNLPADVLALFQQPATEAAKRADAATAAANTAAKSANTAAQSATQASASATSAAQAANTATSESIQATTDSREATAECREIIDTASNLEALGLFPMGMTLDYPTSIVYDPKYVGYIRARLLPERVYQNIIYLSDNRAVSVAPDGRITVIAAGESVVHVIPTCNAALYRSVLIRVLNPALRLVKSNSLRFTSSGTLRLT